MLEVKECFAAKGEVLCRVKNMVSIGECKNMNLPGVVVDMPTMTEKDKTDIVDWGPVEPLVLTGSGSLSACARAACCARMC